jgi:hypothetical protein
MTLDDAIIGATVLFIPGTGDRFTEARPAVIDDISCDGGGTTVTLFVTGRDGEEETRVGVLGWNDWSVRRHSDPGWKRGDGCWAWPEEPTL